MRVAMTKVIQHCGPTQNYLAWATCPERCLIIIASYKMNHDTRLLLATLPWAWLNPTNSAASAERVKQPLSVPPCSAAKH